MTNVLKAMNNSGNGVTYFKKEFLRISDGNIKREFCIGSQITKLFKDLLNCTKFLEAIA